MIVFRPGRVIEGVNGKVHERMAVVIEGERIVRVTSAAEFEVPPTAKLIDAPEATLMPGMIDAHVHLAYDGAVSDASNRADTVSNSYPALALRAAAHAAQTLSHGFTAVRDLNAPGNVVLALRDAVAAGHVPGPRIRACGHGLTISGGHMDKGGWADHLSLDNHNAPCDGPEGFRQGVRQQVRLGADFIKINLCGGSIKDPARPWLQEMTDEEVTAAIDEAHRRERTVAAHTSGGPSVAMAIRAGLDSIEHGHWIDEETADLMAKHGATYVPTLLINERNFELGRALLGGSEAGWEWLERSREDKWLSLERVRSAGAPIALGTDAGFMLPHGVMNARELELLVQGGLSPLEALEAATGTGAKLLGLDSGAVQEGRLADLLLVNGNPLTDIRVLQDPTSFRVFLGGVEVQK